MQTRYVGTVEALLLVALVCVTLGAAFSAIVRPLAAALRCAAAAAGGASC